jgi:RNA polymerase sigma factor (sigma-70 family)
VLRFARRRVPDDDEAEDVGPPPCSPTPCGGSTASSRARRPSSPGSTRSRGGASLTRARAVARRRASLELLERERLALVDESEYGAQLAAALGAALARLPEPQRQVFVLKLLRGLTFAEIAGRVGTTEAACKMRFAHGLEAVRVELAGKGIGP